MTALSGFGQQVGRVDGGEAAVATPDGRADGFDDDDFAFAHGASLGRDLTGRSSRRGVLVVGVDVALAQGRAEGRAGLLDAPAADGLGGVVDAPVGLGGLVGGSGRRRGQLGGGDRWSCASMDLSMQRGCDS